MMKLKYDLVVPLGFNCVSAAQLRLRGLRVMSMPFDWVEWDGDNGFVNRLGMLQSNFKDWLNGDNLTVASLNGGDNHVVVYDRKYGISFPHDFVGGKIGTPPEPDELKRICEKYSRRTSRMMDAIKGMTNWRIALLELKCCLLFRLREMKWQKLLKYR